jgi:hypothetical protein
VTRVAALNAEERLNLEYKLAAIQRILDTVDTEIPPRPPLLVALEAIRDETHALLAA